jgi:hypothetical protein
MANKLRSSLYVVLAGVVLLLAYSVPASAQVLSDFSATNSSTITLPKLGLTQVNFAQGSAPNSGCPCAVFVSYFVPIQNSGTSSSSIDAEAVAVDGSNQVTFDGSEQIVDSGSNLALERSGLAFMTVNDGDNVKVTVYAEPAKGGLSVEPQSKLLMLPNEIDVFILAAGTNFN